MQTATAATPGAISSAPTAAMMTAATGLPIAVTTTASAATLVVAGTAPTARAPDLHEYVTDTHWLDPGSIRGKYIDTLNFISRHGGIRGTTELTARVLQDAEPSAGRQSRTLIGRGINTSGQVQ